MLFISGLFGAALATSESLQHLAGAPASAGPESESARATRRHLAGKAAIAAPDVASQDGLCAGLLGEVRWRSAQLQSLAAGRGHATALLQAYVDHGSACLDLLSGAFVVVLFDSAKERMLTAVDRIGHYTVYYAPAAGGLLLSSDLHRLMRHPEMSRELSLQGIYDYVYFNMVPSPECIYTGVRKLPGGHLLELDRGNLRLHNYWRPKFATDGPVDERALGEELLQTLRGAVQRTSANAKVGAFLSGGLDSSTVSGLLAQQRQQETPTFSIGFDAEGYDELPFARISAHYYGTKAHERYVTPEDVVAATPAIAAAYAEPFGNSSAIPTFYCAELAADQGIERLLAGDGGDELFAGNTRYTKQQVFELYYRVPASLRAVLGPVISRLPDLPLVGKAKSYVKQALVPLPDRLQSYNYLHRMAPASVFDDELLSAVDTELPLRLLRAHYQRLPEATMVDRMLYLDWQFTLADNDLRKVTQTSAVHGVAVAYPFLDDDVVELSCRIPAALKLKGRELRSFYKHATKDFLPPEVLTKSKHGFGLPFGVWMSTRANLQELAYDSLRSLAQRDYFRAGFIDRVIDLHRTDHAAYYGELVWVLMMLQLWLEAHAGR